MRVLLVSQVIIIAANSMLVHMHIIVMDCSIVSLVCDGCCCCTAQDEETRSSSKV